MKLLLSALLAAAPLLGQAQLNFELNIGDPDYYGQIYYGDGPAPQVINYTPVIAFPNVSGVYSAPIYLRVSPYCYQNWQQCCQNFSACFVPVYFVQDYWYQQSYIPWFRNQYPYDIPKYINRYPYDIPKYAPAPRGGWHGMPPERLQRRNDQFELLLHR